MGSPTVAFNQWLDYVLPEVPGCPDLKALQEIHNACVEFTQRSWVWKYDHPLVTVSQNQQVYPYVSMDGNSVVHVIVDLWFLPYTPPGQGTMGGVRRLFPKGHDELREMNQNWKTWNQAVPLYYTGPSEAQGQVYASYGYGFQLVPYVNATSAGQLQLECVLAVSRAATQVPAWLFERYLEPIKKGALWKIAGSPGKKYSDPQVALYYEGEFRREWKAAYNDGMRDQTRAVDQTFSLARHT